MQVFIDRAELTAIRYMAYVVFSSLDKMEENHPRHGGVIVMQGEAIIAEVTCDAETVVGPFWTVSDAKQALGVCWNLDTQTWGGCDEQAE